MDIDLIACLARAYVLGLFQKSNRNPIKLLMMLEIMSFWKP